MDEAREQAFRKVQLAEAALLEVFADICEKHGLRYYLAYGTLIGAVRHQGFIPWDDDIDIMMPRRDYEAFLKVTEKDLPGDVRINHYSRADYNFYGSNIRMESTRAQFAVPFGDHLEWENVWIDIIPMDGVPTDEGKRARLFKRFRLNTLLLRIAVTARIGAQAETPRGGLEKLAVTLNTRLHLGKLLTIRGCQRRIDRTKSQMDYETAELVHGWVFAYKEKCVYHREDFGEGVRLPFEGREYTVPKGYDRVLRQIYGDYMQLPPVEKRVQSHSVDFRECGEENRA